MSFGEAQRQGKERAARERAERARKLENFHYTATAGNGVQITTPTFTELTDAQMKTARKLGYTLVLTPTLNERQWQVRAVKL